MARREGENNGKSGFNGFDGSSSEVYFNSVYSLFNLNSGKDLSIIRLTWPINVGFKDSRTIYQLFYITSVNNDKRNFPSKFRHHFSPK